VTITWTVTRQHKATLLVQIEGECAHEATEEDLLEAGFVPIERVRELEQRIEKCMGDET
jgi:hypothetical protein